MNTAAGKLYFSNAVKW